MKKVYNVVNKINKFDVESLKEVAMNDGHINSLHKLAFKEIHNHITQFITDSVKDYKEREVDGETWEDEQQFFGRVICGLPGHAKTTSLGVIAKRLIKEGNTPLLIAFKTNRDMDDFNKDILNFCEIKGLKDKVLLVNESNFKRVKSEIKNYQIVLISARRFFDLQLGYGSYKTFDQYYSEEESYKRTVIIDEMPEFRDCETFKGGDKDNYTNWVEAYAEYVNTNEQPTKKEEKKVWGKPKPENKEEEQIIVSKQDLWSAQNTIEFAFNCLNTEYIDNAKDSVPIGNLKKYIENSPTYNTFIKVMKKFETLEQVRSDHKKRMKWFMQLLDNEQEDKNVGVLNKDDKYLSVLCSKYINYLSKGNVLILDGTAKEVENIYNANGFEVVECKNYHDYANRLHIHHHEINTNKNNRGSEKTIEMISNDIKWINGRLGVQNKEMFPLVMKSDVEAFRKTGVISSDMYRKFYAGIKSDDDESTSISLMNAVGTNCIGDKAVMAMAGLPIRHASFYKLHAIAMFDTGINVSTFDSFDEEYKTQKKNEIVWFIDNRVQQIYESLFIADFSQIMHRINIRNLSLSSRVDIILYTRKKGWVDRIVKYFGVPDKHYSFQKVVDVEKFTEECTAIMKKVKEFIKKSKKKELFAHDIVLDEKKSAFRSWFRRSWDMVIQEETASGKTETLIPDMVKREIILDIMDKQKLMIEINEKQERIFKLK
ncbi:hypothetical protein [Aneurinibacillus tyrosinisolvens]|uniref:hypothetical protein n=1 Tax=Aneurinibacillus tyrosinisolvens TaxID=1443435 RepID=UPI00063F6392|nr:hypothetical protein [Aneurinibacillus tyrosinisolvens]